MKLPAAFVSLADVPEDDRIRLIAAKAKEGLVVAVCVEDRPAKIARYRRKLEAAGCRIVKEGKGPIAGVATLQVAGVTH